MTKFDIRLRRKQFTQSRIERHKNYQSLMERHYEATKKKTKGIMVLVFLVILIIAILLVFFNIQEKPKTDEQKDHISMNTNIKKSIDIYKITEFNLVHALGIVMKA